MGKIVYKDDWVTIEKERHKVRGKSVEFTKTVQPDVAVVVPILDNGDVLLERQYRHVINKFIYELPAGHIEKGEKPILAARREFEEETGFKVKRIEFMFMDYASPGVTDRAFYYFHARVGEKSKRNPDSYEVIELAPMSIKRVDAMIRSNRIKDHKTIAGYLYYKNYVMKS